MIVYYVEFNQIYFINFNKESENAAIFLVLFYLFIQIYFLFIIFYYKGLKFSCFNNSFTILRI